MKISPTGSGSVNINSKNIKVAQLGGNDFGPPANSAAPYTPDNPNWQNLNRLTNCTVVLMGSSLDITNQEYSISLPLTPEQIQQLTSELGQEGTY